MGKDLYQPQEPSSPPLGLEEKAKKSLQGRLLNLNRCLTYNHAKEKQHRAISAIICCRARVAMIPHLQGWSHQLKSPFLYLCLAVQSFPVSTSFTRVACECWWKTKVLDRSLSPFFVPPVAAGEDQMGWGICLKEEP